MCVFCALVSLYEPTYYLRRLMICIVHLVYHLSVDKLASALSCLSCSTDLRLNQPRYATLPNIMKAKSKVLKKLTLQELNVEIKSDLEVVEVTEPPKRKAGVILSSVDELIDKLQNEAHVL